MLPNLSLETAGTAALRNADAGVAANGHDRITYRHLAAANVVPPGVGKARTSPDERLSAVEPTEPPEREVAREAESAAGPGERGRTPVDAIANARVAAPTRGNRRLEALFAAVNADPQVRAWWHVAQVNSERLGMSDHSWVHVQIVVNIALRLLRLLVKAGVEPAMVADHGMRNRDAEVVVSAGALLHDIGMSIHRTDHEAYSLFLAERKLRELLDGVYDEPELTVLVAEVLHAIIGHRRRGEPFTLEAGVVRVADALDMAHGRSRLPVESGHVGIHSISAAAIDEINIASGEDRAVRIEIRMNNSAGIFQVDDLLARKLRGTPLANHVEVVAMVEGETEKRLLTEFRIP
jgi:metal-dependent HD superfamily phosphatase/phosphodiesterase